MYGRPPTRNRSRTPDRMPCVHQPCNSPRVSEPRGLRRRPADGRMQRHDVIFRRNGTTWPREQRFYTVVRQLLADHKLGTVSRL